MKYTHDNHVRMILLWHGMLGFDTYKDAEAAILFSKTWDTLYDTSDWKPEELDYVNKWREEQTDKNAANDLSNNILSRYFGVKGIKS